MSDRKTGTYYWEYFNNTKNQKLNRLIQQKKFKTKKEAIKFGIKQWEKGKWIQGELVYTKNILRDITVANLTTKGVIVAPYNKETGKWEVLARAKNYDKTSIY